MYLVFSNGKPGNHYHKRRNQSALRRPNVCIPSPCLAKLMATRKDSKSITDLEVLSAPLISLLATRPRPFPWSKASCCKAADAAAALVRLAGPRGPKPLQLALASGPSAFNPKALELLASGIELAMPCAHTQAQPSCQGRVHLGPKGGAGPPPVHLEAATSQDFFDERVGKAEMSI